MPLDALETILTCALGIIGVLLTMLIALVVYVFLSLKGEVLGIKSDISELSRSRAKLVHKAECRETAQRMHIRIDEQEAQLLGLTERMARVETALDLTECS